MRISTLVYVGTIVDIYSDVDEVTNAEQQEYILRSIDKMDIDHRSMMVTDLNVREIDLRTSIANVSRAYPRQMIADLMKNLRRPHVQIMTNSAITEMRMDVIDARNKVELMNRGARYTKLLYIAVFAPFIDLNEEVLETARSIRGIFAIAIPDRHAAQNNVYLSTSRCLISMHAGIRGKVESCFKEHMPWDMTVRECAQQFIRGMIEYFSDCKSEIPFEHIKKDPVHLQQYGVVLVKLMLDDVKKDLTAADVLSRIECRIFIVLCQLLYAVEPDAFKDEMQWIFPFMNVERQ
jgi:hypothetical protein